MFVKRSGDGDDLIRATCMILSLPAKYAACPALVKYYSMVQVA